MIAWLNPYDLTARDTAAMVALLLADEVVTVLPSPEGTPTLEAVGRAAERLPAFSELLDSWSWAMPLFHAGVLAGSGGLSDDALHEIRGSLGEIEHDDAFASIRPLMHGAIGRTDDGYLRAFAADLLKSGTDPGIGLPVAVGIDRAAARHGGIAVRSEARSQATAFESRMLDRAVSFTVPYIAQASGQRLVAARCDLEPQLDALRDAVDSWDTASCRPLAAELADAFGAKREELCRSIHDDEPRVRTGTATVTLGELPADAVLISGVQAARRYFGNAGEPAAPRRARTGDTLLVRTMIVKRMGDRR